MCFLVREVFGLRSRVTVNLQENLQGAPQTAEQGLALRFPECTEVFDRGDREPGACLGRKGVPVGHRPQRLLRLVRAQWREPEQGSAARYGLDRADSSSSSSPRRLFIAKRTGVCVPSSFRAWRFPLASPGASAGLSLSSSPARAKGAAEHN